MTTARLRLLVPILALALVAASCGGRVDEGTDTAGTERESPPGAIESTEDVLPEGFPEDFPLPEGRRIVYSVAHERGFAVALDAAQEHAQLRAFFASEFPQRGWTITACSVTEREGSPITVMAFQKGREELATVTIGVEVLDTDEPYKAAVTWSRLPEDQHQDPGEPVACPD